MANEVAVIRDYDIRDKKLVDATAQTTIESTDAIEMKTTDGNQVFIDKASFIKAVGQAFTASDPKTFTKLLGMNGDGPMGIGASDLASVLGVGRDWKTVTLAIEQVYAIGTPPKALFLKHGGAIIGQAIILTVMYGNGTSAVLAPTIGSDITVSGKKNTSGKVNVYTDGGTVYIQNLYSNNIYISWREL